MAEPVVASEASSSPSQPQSQSQSQQQGDRGKEDPGRKKNNVRKRTKTGCLTCRKRRIKCDEEKPTCKNCLKSKRHCEGYSQRVVFKDPVQAGLQGPIIYSGAGHLVGQLQGRASSQLPLPVIAPKPPGFDYAQQSLHYAPYNNQQTRGLSPPYGFNQALYSHGSYPQAPTNYLKVAHETHTNGSIAHSGSPGGPAYLHDKQANVAILTKEQENELACYQIRNWESQIPDDEAAMGDSDDEHRDPRQFVGPLVQKLSALWDAHGTRVRTFNTFAQWDELAHYTAASHFTELKDPRMIAIFLNFIKVTGPSMSLYERHPFDLPEEVVVDPNTGAGQNVWSYTFPLISFHHPALLHAILALSCLQIASLQGNFPPAAMKHYALALRRVAKNMTIPSRRMHPATLAATLLMAYYEVWSSNHSNWCNHLFGARILFSEISMREMSRNCLPAKRRRQRQKDIQDQAQISHFYSDLKNTAKAPLFDLDYSFLSMLSGQDVTAEEYGLDEADDGYVNLGGYLGYASEKEISTYENLRDLFWWYCKMDVYQSMLGGTKLFMEYEHWTQCPPRAAMSKYEAVYGTYDHLILLLGRLADFASRDLPRKRKASQNQGSQPGPNSPPAFPGIIPTNGKVKAPMGFNMAREPSPQGDADDGDPQGSLKTAEEEWEAIRRAFEVFEEALGPEFQALGPLYTDQRDSPFGTPLQYRTFSVAGIWMNYYMGMIHLYRTKPERSPAAMQAAVQAAADTAKYAENIGRIAVGLSDDERCKDSDVSTTVSAAFIESCFCLFVAAVQYVDNDQRQWMVRRMHRISRLTGWQSARQIADGCESNWIKAAQVNRGPPYTRAVDMGFEIPPHIRSNPRRIDRKIQELNSSPDDRIVLAKSEQTSYALGIIGCDSDLGVLILKDK